MKLLVISGSLRKGSFNTALAHALAARAPQGVAMEVTDLSDVPLFNQDLEKEMPSGPATLKERIRAADGVIIATPEYGRAVPGVVKNALDWTTRPKGTSAWKGKPAFVTGATDGAIGTAVAQKELRSNLATAGAIVLPDPELYVGRFMERFDENGRVVDEKTAEKMDEALAAFVAFVRRLS